MGRKLTADGQMQGFGNYGDILKLYDFRREAERIRRSVVTADQLSASPTLRSKMTRTAKVVKVVPLETDFLYIRDRAVSAGNVIEHTDGTVEVVPMAEVMRDWPRYSAIIRGANSNGDFWSTDELMRSYKTFIGKSVFVDHQSELVDDARGIILDAVYNDRWHYVELLEAIDKKAFPQLANAIEKRYVTGTSMGCMVGKATCSICGNVATRIEDICEHVENYKGVSFNGVPVVEFNENVEFYENSIVTIPADNDARIMERVASHQPHRRIVVNHHHHVDAAALRGECNARCFDGKVMSLAAQLGELPWS